MIGTRHIPWFIVVLGLLVWSGGCELFSTRDPEPPKGGSSAFIPATSADLVIQNLKNAISERNTVNYLRCFVDTLSSGRSFEFIPTAAAAGRYASAFASWSLASERAWFSSLSAYLQPSASSVLNLNGTFSILASDSAVYQGDYQLVFPHGIAGVPETTRGNLQFVIAIDRNSTWGITRWTDNPIGNDPAWSEIKGRFAN